MSGRRSSHRRSAFLVLLGVAVGVSAMLWLRPVRGPAGVAVSPLARPSAELALGQRIPEVSLIDVPFDEAVERVAQLSGVPINIEAKAFEMHQSTRRKVVVRLRNATLEYVLDQLMEQIEARNSFGI